MIEVEDEQLHAHTHGSKGAPSVWHPEHPWRAAVDLGTARASRMGLREGRAGI